MSDLAFLALTIAVSALLLAGVVAASRRADRHRNPTALHDTRDPDERRNR